MGSALKALAIAGDEGETDVNSTMITIDPSEAGWSAAGGRFWTPAAHLDHLPAGIYSVGSSQRIGIYLQARKAISDNLLNLPSLGCQAILDEIDKFWDMAPKFKELGFVHKRGILLHGEPGTGKTSIMHLLIQQMIKKGGIVLLGDPGSVAAGMALVRDREPDRPIFVPLEDVDGMLSGGGEQMLLNLLDGANQVNGVVFFATTNYIKKLPPRLTSRPSRFDIIKEIGMPSPEDMVTYVRYVTPDAVSDDTVASIAENITGLPMSFVKEMVILVAAYGLDPTDARKRLDEIRGNGQAPVAEVKFTNMLG